jgi:hypothetical protein
LRTHRAGGCIQAVELLELSQLSQVPSLFAPGLRRLGVGARLHEDGKGVRLSTVFMLEGVRCK